ncbi:MAG TPA: hypothetical protein VLJ21_03870 [Candidatus Binatia bacterium]|nr:hypothetical protein [Candidatus Binatia bacterium]
MATPLDLGLLAHVSSIFPFLFVLVLVYAILSGTKIFGDNKGIYAFIAFVLAVMTLFSPLAVKSIDRMAPWFVLLFIFGIFFVLAFMVFGVEMKTITDVVKKDSTVFYWILAIVLIIGIGSVTSVVSEEKGFKSLSQIESGNETVAPTPAGQENVGFFQTLFHPKVLGMALLLLIAMFTVRHLASNE